MSERSTVPLTRCIQAVVRQAAESATDASLLSSFVRSRDPRAFEEIVRRHGPLILSACRHILSDPADADDACQATFVLLYRKAHSIRRGSLGGWLFHVARRAAIEMKRSAARRQFHEARTARAEMAAGPDLSWREACAILHEELDRLPARYRLPLIACYLEGRTQDEAARELGWPAAVLRGRVDRGRARLGCRLRLRGVTLSTGLLSAAGATVPANVTAAAVASPSPAVAAVVRSLAGSAGRAWSAAGAAVAVVLVGGTVLLGGVFGRQDPKPPAPPPKEPVAERPAPRTDAFGDPLPEGAIARLGTVRFNHGDGLKALLTAPDGRTVISVGNGKARVWDTESGRELRQFSTGKKQWEENEEAVLSTDGKRLTLLWQTFQGDPLREFDVATGKQLRDIVLPIKRRELSVYRRNAIAPDGRLCALHTPDRVHVFDVETAKELYSLPKKGRDVTSVAFAGPERLITADTAKAIEVWEARTGKPIRSFDHGGSVQMIVASSDGKLLATLTHQTGGGIDRFLDPDIVRVWDLEKGLAKHEFKSRQKRCVLGLVFARDSKSLAVYSVGHDGRELTVWDCATGDRQHEISGLVAPVLTISPDCRRLAAGGESGKFAVFDLASGRTSMEVRSAGDPAIFLSPSGDRVNTLSHSQIVSWDGNTGRWLESIDLPPGPYGTSSVPKFSSDGRLALICNRAGEQVTLLVWNVADRKVVLRIPLSGLTHFTARAFSADSSRLVIRQTGKEAPIGVWDPKSGKEIRSFPDQKGWWAKEVFLSADGNTVVVPGTRVVGYSLADGKELFVWRVEKAPPGPGPQIGVLGGSEELNSNYRQLTVSPDGNLAAYTLDGGMGAVAADRLVLCDVVTGRLIRRWSDGATTGWSSERLHFSPDGRLLASTINDVVHVWETATGKEVRSFRGHLNKVEALAFSANSRRLATSSQDSTTIIWGLSAPGVAESETCWADLSSEDAAKAYAAVWRLADAADDVALPLFRKNLRPVAATDQEKIRKAVADLDSDQFRVRDRAFKELGDAGHHAGPLLRDALARKPSAEAGNRIQQLLAKLVGPPASGETLRTYRALAALEAKQTAAAKEFLRELANGAADAWLTQEAQAALRRLDLISARGKAE